MRVDDPPAADEGRVDVVAEGIFDRQPDGAAGAVAAAGGLLLESLVGASDPAQQVDLLGVEEARGDQVAVGVEAGTVRLVEAPGHGSGP